MASRDSRKRKGASLHEMSESEYIKCIGSAARALKANFCCGGVLRRSSRPVRIAYETRTDQAPQTTLEWVDFPCELSAQIDQLVHACSPASFGEGNMAVYDPEYRKALKLDSTSFLTNLSLSEFSLLEEIRNLMIPSASSIRAELYKLNIYQPEGFFKPHVDTPRSGDMFGSLVITLPFPHTGGELVVTHGNASQTFTSSGSDGLQWVAFYSDCEHEVIKVKSGLRITLTYNLYAQTKPAKDVASSLDPTTFPVYQVLCAARDCPEFLIEGGTLGLSCQHSYPHQQGDKPVKIDAILKGADATVFRAAASAGLTVQVKPVWDNSKSCFDENDEDPVQYVIGDQFEDEFVVDEQGLYGDGPGFDVERFPRERDVIWCRQDFEWKVGAVLGKYGNEPTMATCYCGAAILITFPPWPRAEK